MRNIPTEPVPAVADATAPYRRSVLVVEDQPLLRDALGRALENWGYSGGRRVVRSRRDGPRGPRDQRRFCALYVAV